MLKLNSKKFIIISILFFLIGSFFIPKIHADTYYDYTIENYRVNINVNEDNSFDITEYITANFNTYKHGIIRRIPNSNSIVRNDGTTSSNKAKISDVKVNDEYNVSNENGNTVIKIGSADDYVSGIKEYVISYTYSLNKDTLKDADEFYFNIIGTEWDTSISGVAFNIKMPKNFDENKLGFSIGEKGAIGYSDLEYNVESNIISGQYFGTLQPYNGITVRLELPDKYFKIDIFKQIINFISDYLGIIIAFGICGLLLLKCIKIKKKQKNVVKPVEFYPPENLKSIDLKYIYNKHYLQYENASMLIELANNGYIEIYETDSKYNYRLIKIKEYDGFDERYKLLMDDLFKTSDNIETAYKHISNFTSSKIYSETTKNNKNYFKKQRIHPLLFFILPFVIFGVVATFSNNASGVAFFPILFIMGFFIPIIAYKTIGNEKTDDGLKLYGRILGFKNFIKTAEKERLEMLVEQNPQYFYDLLPYAYVLGVTDVWIKNFERIMMPAPNWYHGDFNANYFMTSMNSSFANIPTGNSSSSGGGSGFSGGGSSGGGSGGGGGSSW